MTRPAASRPRSTIPRSSSAAACGAAATPPRPRRGTRPPDRLLQLPDRPPRRPLDPERLGLALRDRQHRLRGAEPHPAGPERLAQERPRPQLGPQPREALGGPLAEVEDLARVVVEAEAQRGEPVALAERVEPLGQGEVHPAARPSRAGERPLVDVRLHLAAPEEQVKLGRSDRGEIDLRRHVPGEPRRDRLGDENAGGQGAHRDQHRMDV